MATKRKKRMRLPNGIGSVHQINDGKQRRNPWRARVPSHVEFNAETGKASQRYINIGYFATETEAIEALFEYRKNPYTLEASVCTFADVYEMWSKKKYPTIAKSAQAGYMTSYNHSKPLHNMKMRDIRTKEIEGIIMSVNGGYQVQAKIKLLWGQVFKYAMEHDIVQKDYSTFVKTRDKAPETTRDAIPKEDIQKLWAEIDKGNETAEIVMIYIYTGLRATELLEVKKENVDIENRIMIAGKKSDAGRDRRIPLHKAILPLIEKRMTQEGELLISRKKKNLKRASISYKYFLDFYWRELMQELNMDYTIHYTRHTFATMMREADIAEDLRKLILGHKNDDVTDRYTHHPDSMLIEAIDKLPGRE
jgi:integrase